MEEITTMATQPPERPVWETFSRAETEDIVKGNIRTAEQKMAEITDQFCTAGYYLRRQLREEMWREAGAENFGQYVQDTYGKSRGWATRMMQINERYSQGGNDPRLDDKYKAYTVSQLQEMLYLPEGGEGEVTPDMTVREIRALRQPAADPDPGEGQQATDQEAAGQQDEPIIDKSGTVFDLSEYMMMPETVNEDDEAAEQERDNSLKQEITRNEWVHMYDEMKRWLPEEINRLSLCAALVHTGIVKDGFILDCRPSGVTINNSKVETWTTAARQLNAIRKAKAKQEAEEAAAAARPGWIELDEEWRTAAAGDQGGQQETDADVCDVAKSEGAAGIEAEDIEVADEYPHDDLPEKWSMDLQAFVEDGQEGSRDEGEGAAEDSGAAGGSQKHMRQYIDSQLRYHAFDVRLLREDCQKNLDELVGYQLDLLSKDAKALIPWPTIRKRRIMVDAYRMLEEAFRIREAKDED